VTSGRATRESRQQKVEAMRAQAAKAEARRRSLIVGTAIITILVVIIAVVVLIQKAHHDSATASGPTPANLAAGNSIVVGKSTAPVTVVAYEDFQCPFCREFESENAGQLAAYVKAGTVRIEYRPIAFLDANSSDDYSTRALNAVAALVNSDPTAFQAYHDALYANQPAEGGPGLTSTKLIDLAVAAGAPKAAMTTAVNKDTYKGWTVRASDAASKAGVNATPTVLVNGKSVANAALLNAAQFKAVIDAAAK
jgi:protein-disulfide isomerase